MPLKKATARGSKGSEARLGFGLYGSGVRVWCLKFEANPWGFGAFRDEQGVGF